MNLSRTIYPYDQIFRNAIFQPEYIPASSDRPSQKIMSHHLKTQNWRNDPCAQKAVLCPPRIDSAPSYTGFRGWFAAWNPTPVHGVVGCFLPVLPPPTGIFPDESQRRLVTILPLWLRNRLPVDAPFPGGSPHRYIR